MLEDLAEEFSEDIPDPYDEEEDYDEEQEEPVDLRDDDDDPPETDRMALETGRKLISEPEIKPANPFATIPPIVDQYV